MAGGDSMARARTFWKLLYSYARCPDRNHLEAGLR